MNLGSKGKGPLFLQHRKNPGRQFSRHRHNGLARGQMLGMSPVHRAIKFPQFRVLADGRPSALNQFTAQAAGTPPLTSTQEQGRYGLHTQHRTEVLGVLVVISHDPVSAVTLQVLLAGTFATTFPAPQTAVHPMLGSDPGG